MKTGLENKEKGDRKRVCEEDKPGHTSGPGCLAQHWHCHICCPKLGGQVACVYVCVFVYLRVPVCVCLCVCEQQKWSDGTEMVQACSLQRDSYIQACHSHMRTRTHTH